MSDIYLLIGLLAMALAYRLHVYRKHECARYARQYRASQAREREAKAETTRLEGMNPDPVC